MSISEVLFGIERKHVTQLSTAHIGLMKAKSNLGETHDRSKTKELPQLEEITIQENTDEMPTASSSGYNNDEVYIGKPDCTSMSQQVKLKDLCSEDKQRVANLIRELSKVNNEKEISETILNDERKKFAVQLLELRAEKERIESEQRTILSQFKDCQKLLVYYQNKIAEDQKDVSRDITKLLSRSSSNKTLQSKSSIKENITLHPAVVMEHNYSEDRYLSHASDDSQEFCVCDGQSPTSSEIPPQLDPHQFVVVGRERSPRRKHSSQEESPSQLYPNSGGTSSEQIASPSFNEVPSRFSTSESTSDEYVDSLAADPKKNFNPTASREALLKQKENLEKEQAHLLAILAEQEKILKHRQHELNKSQVQYVKRKSRSTRNVAKSTNRMENSESKRFADSIDSMRPDAVNFKETKRGKTQGESIIRSRSQPTSSPSVTFDPTAIRSSLQKVKNSLGKPTGNSLHGKQQTYRIPPDIQSLLQDHNTSTSSNYKTVTSTESERSGYCRGNTTLNNPFLKPYSSHHDCDNCYQASVRNLGERKPLQKSAGKHESNPGENSSENGNHVVVGNRSSTRNSTDNTLAEEDLVVPDVSHSLHDKMNNISSLRELASSINDHNPLQSVHANISSLPKRSNTSEDKILSYVDSEDSKLLEDVFFVKY